MSKTQFEARPFANRSIHPFRKSAVSLVAIGSLTACGGAGESADADSNNQSGLPDTITMVVPTEPGGGFDNTARGLESGLEEALGTDLAFEYSPGGELTIGIQTMLEGSQGCDSLLFHAMPHVALGAVTQEVPWQFEDLAPIGGATTQPGIIRVANDSPWETLNDLIEDARQNPGEITVSMSSFASPHFLAIRDIERVTGVEFNIVPFESGAESRNAVVSGEVDMVHAGVFNTLPVADQTRALAVHTAENEWPDLTNDAPTVNEALGEDLAERVTQYGLFTSQECADGNPDQYAELVTAVEEVVNSEDYAGVLSERDELASLRYVSADDWAAANEVAYDEVLEMQESGLLEY